MKNSMNEYVNREVCRRLAPRAKEMREAMERSEEMIAEPMRKLEEDAKQRIKKGVK